MAASIIGGLVGQGGGAFFSGLSSLVNSIKGKNPGDALALQELLEKYKADAAQADKEVTLAKIDAETKQDSTAGENIRTMLSSSDWFVRRGIVTPMWIGSLVLLWNYCILPTVAIWRSFPAVNLPPMFWYLYIFSIGGSVGHGIIDRAIGGAGGSASLLGLKLDSKGD